MERIDAEALVVPVEFFFFEFFFERVTLRVVRCENPVWDTFLLEVFRDERDGLDFLSVLTMQLAPVFFRHDYYTHFMTFSLRLFRAVRINEAARDGAGRNGVARKRLEPAVVDSLRYKVTNLRGHTVFEFESMSADAPQAKIGSPTLSIQEDRRCLQMGELKNTLQVLQGIVPVRRY